MAFLIRSLVGLSVLGGAAAGIGLPTNNAVQSIFNKQQLRKRGGHDSAGKNYENYWYGNNGFGDSRTKQVSTGGGEQEIKTSLAGVREEGGKSKLGEGLEKKFESWLKGKSICNGVIESNSNENCGVGNIEFVEEKDKSLFGRIPIKDKDGKNVNVYVKWLKCLEKSKNSKNTRDASGIGFGSKREENSSQIEKILSGSNQQNKHSGCTGETQSPKK